MNVQIIEKNGKPEWAIIPYKEFQKIIDSLEDAEDIADIKENLKAISEKKEPTIPGEVTFDIIEGTHPVRAWRNFKKIKMNDLAQRVGISSAYLSQIENEKRNPTIDTLKALAKALGVDIDMLI